jgi:hypothetical protein
MILDSPGSTGCRVTNSPIYFFFAGIWIGPTSSTTFPVGSYCKFLLSNSYILIYKVQSIAARSFSAVNPMVA